MSTPFSNLGRKMTIKEQFSALVSLRCEIEKKLINLDFNKTKEMILWLAKSNDFQKLKTKENQMIMLDCFTNIWVEEKRKLEPLGVPEDIFFGVHSLNDIESKYLLIKYCALRYENNVPDILCEQTIDEIITKKISGIAIGKIIVFETSQKVQNIVKIAKVLRNKGQVMTSILLLQYASEQFDGDRNILFNLADIWIEGQQWRQAYDCLSKIRNPLKCDKEIIEELQKVI